MHISEKDKKPENKINQRVMRSFIVATCIIIAAIIILIWQYLINFGTTPSPNHEDWGAFGDYFGGILNPIIGLCAFLALLFTIKIQSSELRKTTKTLESQALLWEKQNFESTFFSLLDILRKSLSDFNLNEYYTKEAIRDLEKEEIDIEGQRALEEITEKSHSFIKSATSEEDFYKKISECLEDPVRLGIIPQHVGKIFFIIKYIKQANHNIDKEFYLDLLSETLCMSERLLVLYTCLTRLNDPLIKFIREFNFFKNIEFTISQNPVVIEAVKKQFNIRSLQ